MIKEAPHFIQTCPVCGRPLQVCIDNLGQMVTCQHCRGQFVARYSNTSDRENTECCNSLLHRADRLLAILACHLCVPGYWPDVQRHRNADRCPSSGCTAEIRNSRYNDAKEQTSYRSEDTDLRDIPSVVLLEYREDVLIRLTADLAARGVRVTQATNATQAIRQYVVRPTDVLIVNADCPHESAWLLASKLHLTHPTARIWIYKHRLSDSDMETASFIGIDELIEYENDMICLATKLLDRLVELPTHANRTTD